MAVRRERGQSRGGGTHHGEYGGIGQANAAILEWCRSNGRLPAGPSWEVYGHWHDDPAQVRTDVYYLLDA